MKDKDNKNIQIGTGYPAFQLAKALRSETDKIEESSKTSKWVQVITGMLSGTLKIGSRTPIKSTPVWVTPEVVKGGFATSNLKAEGPLQKHEIELLDKLNLPIDKQARKSLNLFYLSDNGIQELTTLLNNNQYSIDVPEEAALLSVALLLQNGHINDAKEILNEITPFFDRLRFYPVITNENEQVAKSNDDTVFVQSVVNVIDKIDNNRVNQNISIQKQSVLVWTPFYDKLISLFLKSFSNKLNSKKEFLEQKIEPFAKVDKEWLEEKDSLLLEYKALLKNYEISNRWTKKGAQFSKLLKILIQFSAKEEYVKKHRNYVKQAVNRYVVKHGVPGSSEHESLRVNQSRQCLGPDHIQARKLLCSRLSVLNPNNGIEYIDNIIKNVEEQDVKDFDLPVNWAIPGYLISKVSKGKVDQVKALVKSGVISSPDMLANLLPQITSNVICSSIKSSHIKNLYRKVYLAFRSRRSLLLTNYESQIGIQEIPWIQKLDQYMLLDNEKQAEKVLIQTFNLAISNFPYNILPNKLLQELRALMAQCNERIPLTDEVAADIFMGGFSPKFVEAALIAADHMEDTLYEKYYDIDYSEIRKNCSTSNGKYETTQMKYFSAMCNDRAGGSKNAYSVAANGKIIEQQQIITTHNLVQLTSFAGKHNVTIEFEELAIKSFKWVSKRFKSKSNNFYANLIMVKNIAYAWRQMIFYISKLEADRQYHLIQNIEEELDNQSTEFAKKFSPLISTLKNLIGSSENNEGYCLTGWSTEEHYLLENQNT